MCTRHLVYKLWAFGGCVWCCGHTIMLCFVLASLALSSVPVSAQSASFRSVDTNSDGVLSFDELAARFGRTGANRLLETTDHNGDRRITVFELRRGSDDDDRDDGGRSGSTNQRDDEGDDDQDDDGRDDDRGDDGRDNEGGDRDGGGDSDGGGDGEDGGDDD